MHPHATLLGSKLLVAIYPSYPHTQDNAPSGNAAKKFQTIIQNLD